ncbi:MAG: DUF4124 domain-containing protein [Burkholderiaceae bacterium]|nr:DUF4124 domain-containing protein [Burkholderiaceae bacterium]
MQNTDAIALVVAASLAWVAPAAEAQTIFKCVDAEGNVTYTEVPCLRSEASSVVDTSSNSADFSSVRRETGRLQSQAAQAAPPSSSQPSSHEPSAAPPAPPAPPAQRSGY